MNSQFAEIVAGDETPLKQLFKVNKSDILLNEVNMRLDNFQTGLDELFDIASQKNEAEILVQSHLEAFGAMIDNFEAN